MIYEADRIKQWVNAADVWAGNERPFLLLDVQMLGNAEAPLLGFEGVLSEVLRKEVQTINDSIFMTQCMALSTYWVFGLYEVMRKVRDVRRQVDFSPLAPIFAETEILRMPLAKHQVKGTPGYREVEHYPTLIVETATRRVGWSVFDPRSESMRNVFRRDLADRFLSARNPN